MNNISSLCLVMIVKNEIKVLSRCFDSVKDYIDYWVICDTGSTDGTQDFIKNYFQEKKIKGELHEHEWKNFGYNRTLAVQSAYQKADYLLLMDADFVFCVKNRSFKNELKEDMYYISYEGSLDYRQTLLVSGKKEWKYIGVTHEYIHSPGAKGVIFDGFTFLHKCDGISRQEKIPRDIQLLLGGLEDEPKNARYMFYLAQSYFDNNEMEKAIEWYDKRIFEGGWEEEVYYSKYKKGLALMKISNFETFSKVLIDAFNFRSSRLEALYEYVKWCRLNKKYKEGFQMGLLGFQKEYPKDMLFVDKQIHEWKFEDELALCSFYSGSQSFSKYIYDFIFEKNIFPSSELSRLQKNYSFFIKNNENKINTKPKGARSSVHSNETKNSDESDEYYTDIREYSEKVAIIIVNYNMPERTNDLVEAIRKITNHPHDIIVVDNASDLMPPSKYSNILLKKNVQAGGGWNMGLHYADALEKMDKNIYFAYCFVTTSTSIQTDKDFIKNMVFQMKRDKKVVGVHPGLTKESTTHWKHLLDDGTKNIYKVNMIDNIFSCYRASWFNKIGRFDEDFTYGWGIDIETSFKAKGKTLLLDLNYLVEKVANIGYKMNRMNMTSAERQNNAYIEMDAILRKKYGSDYNRILCEGLQEKSIY
jgi:glycosyltransferase involved in cell wall biosynthesis